MVLLHLGLSGMPHLYNVDLPTLTGDAINAYCFQAMVILDRLKESSDLPRQEANSFDA